MKKITIILLFLGACHLLPAQEEIPYIEQIQLDQLEPGQVYRYWLKMMDNGLSQPICVPLLIVKGKKDGPVLGLTAAIHGNELNGIRVIQRVFENLVLDSLAGTILAVPGLNAVSIPLDQRRYIDEEDLNRNFPGKAKGNRSQQYAWQIKEKILPHFDYLVDMHTASFGRENTLYVRADLNDPQMERMARLLDADIILNNKGVPSTQEQLAATRTMRAEAVLLGIPTITVEYGNPQVYQSEMIDRGTVGIQNLLVGLKMMPGRLVSIPPPVICKKSYWIFVDDGGLLEVHADLNQQVKKGSLIATLRNPFGDVLKTYLCPEDGIIIGKSSNPVNMEGGRIIHLGILETEVD